MRVFIKNLPILKRPRLGFIRVANQVDRLSTLAVHQLPFHPTQKAGSTPSPQSRKQYFLPNLFLGRKDFAIGRGFGLERKDPLPGLVTAVAEIAFDVRGISRLVDVLKDEFALGRHGGKLGLTEWEVFLG